MLLLEWIILTKPVLPLGSQVCSELGLASLDVRRNWRRIPYSICLRWVCMFGYRHTATHWLYSHSIIFLAGWMSVCFIKWVFVSRGLNAVTAVFGVFVSQVYVQVNKEAEHNEDMKQAARDFFRQLEQRESEVVSLWQQFREITVDEYQRVYKVQPAGLNNSMTNWLHGQNLNHDYQLWLSFHIFSAVRGPLWYLLRGVLSPRSSPGGGGAAAEPRPVENLRVSDSTWWHLISNWHDRLQVNMEWVIYLLYLYFIYFIILFTCH